jgi:sodium transport system ATP-binding protein
MNQNKSIEVSHLTRHYPGRGGLVRALEDVSFACEPGGIYGIVGPNGSGKTTCLRLIAGLLHPTSGSVNLQGADLSRDFDKFREQVGFVSCTAQPYERLTPREMLIFCGRLAGLEEALEPKINSLISDLGITEFQDRRCGALSTGMRQRVAIARALVHNPGILIFDEPLTGLDIVARRSLMDQLLELKSSQKTLLLSTHIPEEAEKLCDHLFILNQGKLVEAGTVEELKDKYLTGSLENVLLTVLTGGRKTDGHPLAHP